MRKTFRIGQKEYKFKKDAITHYRAILNSYEFGQSLNYSDLNDLNDLIDFSYLNDFAELEFDEIESLESEFNIEEFKKDLQLTIIDIKVAKVQFNTRCFEVFYDNKESEYISYIMMVRNQTYNPENLFYKACRNSIQQDLMNVKQAYFDKHSVKGQVKCQETGLLSKWTELAVDHRQPNTFSIIVDRFKESNRINLDKIVFTSNGQNHIIFHDNILTENFKQYHREKANLRIVRTECNSKRSGMARLKKTSKDLTIE